MPHRLTELLRAAVPLHSGEHRTALLMFAYSFLAMTAWNIIRPLTRSSAITDLGSDNLPWVQLAFGLLIGVLMQGYSTAIARLPRRAMLPATQGAIVALLVLFSALLRTGATWVSVSFYFLGLILGILLISQFWTLANDIYDPRQAKRLFGFIGGGASLGGAFGSAITAASVSRIGEANMVLVGALALTACIAIVARILRLNELTAAAEPWQDERGVGAREALRLLRQSAHLRVMALVIGFAAAGAQILEQQLNMVAELSRGSQGSEGVAEFLAQIQMVVSLGGFVVQIALTRWIHRSFGLTIALLLLPFGLGLTGVLILVTGALWAPAVARVLDATLRYTVDKTTREVLFLPLPTDLKYRAKPFIDVTADRVARAIAAVVLLVLIQPWGFGLDWRALSYATVGMTVAWVAAALVARREYLAAFRRSIGTQAIAPDTIRTEVGDAATIEALVEELSNPDPDAVLYAIGMLETLDKRHLISPLLLQHASPQVRVRALRALGAVRARIAIRWKSAVERLVHDGDVDVRAAALRALAEFSHEDTLVVLRRYLTDPAPGVIVAACVGLANSAHRDDADAAEAALRRLIDDTRTQGDEGRREAAMALGHITDPRFRPLLVPLLYDHDSTVVERAIRSARALGAGDGLFLPALLSLLGHRTLKPLAREALVGYGPDVVGALAHALGDTREHAWIRRHIPATLAAIPTQESMDALIESLDDPDGFLRYKTVVAIQRLRRTHPQLTFSTAAVERLVLHEASRYYTYLALRHDVLRDAESSGTLLARALGEKLGRTLDRIFRLLGLLYPADDVTAARDAIENGTPHRRAAAVEYLDNLLGGTIRRRVLPIVDQTPLAEKLRHAYLVLKSRPRDVDDALAQLVHDDDAILAASAVHFIVRRGLWSLAGDLEYLLTHRDEVDLAAQAAAWALQVRRGASGARGLSSPAVELASRLRTVPLCEYVSVDELCRVATLGEEVRHAAGRRLYQHGTLPRYVEFLMNGSVARLEDRQWTRTEAPTLLGLQEVLEGGPSPADVRTVEPTHGFRIPAGDFLTMASDNALLAQGLFRMLLPEAERLDHLATATQTGLAEPPLQQFDQALSFRDHPLLSRATPAQLLALIAAGQEVVFASDTVLFEADATPAVYQVIDGELVLEWPTGPQAAGPGTTFGVAATLGGAAAGCRGRGIRAGRALRIGRDDFFTVLTDHADLMQNVFSQALRFRMAAPAEAAVAAPQPADA